MSPSSLNSGQPARVPTPQQQKVLDRILVQRERLRARRAALRQARAVAAGAEVRVEPDAPLAARLVAFARLHPVAVAAVVGAAVLAGPQRLVRWATLVMPLVMRMRRG
ncbi:hypothetical protein HND92_09000 [Diaphorobacter sp. JS3050]|uniref:hypothetical protein n=1 Tax=Diaphorobacter TaxID=238749 RepID=UPI000CDA54BD|nr:MULTISPECIES: hypothetical protein [unclassified Diaphorobacter]POR09238.1 hypothetical protein BV908_16705 [Diaphorobacter sp. LR2014-1]QJY33111.1 hypothetical protein HND92_09000 [Diaphorobacter sp. JS3050]